MKVEWTDIGAAFAVVRIHTTFLLSARKDYRVGASRKNGWSRWAEQLTERFLPTARSGVGRNVVPDGTPAVRRVATRTNSRIEPTQHPAHQCLVAHPVPH
jgi:hypothetical protein